MNTGRHTAQAAIQAVVRAIAPGSVLSYGEVARRAGLPRRARLVARVLATSTDARLPWHRVVRSDGRIAFAPDSADFECQRRRLQAEGVEVVGGRVRAVPVSLDETLWR